MTGPSPRHPSCCTLSLCNDLVHLPMVQGFVRAYAATTGFSEQVQERLELLIDEVVTNVIEGAFAEGETGFIDVSCERIPAGMQITVHDDGMPYDPSLIPEYDPGADVESQTGAGLGSYLIRRIADTVEFHNLGSRGKETVLVKFLEGETVADALAITGEPSTDRPSPVPEAEREEMRYGHLEEKQAIEVCRCIYDAYRYTYVNEHMYYPDRVVALNRSGRMLSMVAATESGEVAGHAALVFPEHTRDIADLACVAVKSRFRGQSVARKLSERLAAAALKNGLSGLFIEQVTVHEYTQRIADRLGFADSGFLLAYSPGMAVQGISEETGGRRTVILGFKYLGEPTPAPLYAPAAHADMVQRLFDDLGAPRTIAAVDRSAPRPRESVLHIIVDNRRSVASVYVPVLGADLQERARAEFHRLRRADVRVIDVFLDLRDPHTAKAAELFERFGFIFTGVLPGGAEHDWLILQFFNGVAVDYDSVQVVRASSRDLLAYVRAHDRLNG